jgi:hypothetical protein
MTSDYSYDSTQMTAGTTEPLGTASPLMYDTACIRNDWSAPIAGSAYLYKEALTSGWDATPGSSCLKVDYDRGSLHQESDQPFVVIRDEKSKDQEK